MNAESLKELPPPQGAPALAPPLEAEPPHKRLARLNREQERVTEALRELKRDWAEKNIKAQATRTPIATSEITFVENRRRKLAGELLKIQTEIGAVNKEVRERKAGGSAGASRTPTKRKACPLKGHSSYDQYFRLAAENELESRLYAKIEAAAKSMLAHAIRTGIEQT